jgi:peroxiredoxin
LESDWDEFDRRNVKVVAIAVQKIDGLMRARNFVDRHAYRFPILFDESRETTKAYGVYHRVGIDAFRIARPSVFVLDPGRTIRWIGVSPNQNARPTTVNLVEAIEAAGKY